MDIKELKEWLNQFPETTTVFIDGEIFEGIELEDYNYTCYQLDFLKSKEIDFVDQKSLWSRYETIRSKDCRGEE